MNGESCFWVVWNPQAGLPRVKHNTELGARKEAERLATCNPNQSFFVLQALTESRWATVTTRGLYAEQPF